ncbi:MAG: carboxypeptidase-like regulatory domain-containing protein, partial [Myxococcales bacterium]
AVLALLLGCELPELHSGELYGPHATGAASVAGLVRDGDTGAPLAAASVSIAGAATRTDEAGAYRLDGLSPGLHGGSVAIAGYRTRAFDLLLSEGMNHFDVPLQRIPCSETGCGANELCNAATSRCEAATGTAELSGGVTDRCTGRALSARVSIGAASTCSASAKAFYRLVELGAGGPQTVAAGKAGYRPFVGELTLRAGFNRFDIELEPEGGCASVPGDVPCSCTEPRCQQ